MLARFGTVDAIEINAAARAMAAERLGKPVGDAPLPTLPGVARAAYDLIAVLDVVEHIDNDVAALRGMAECLAPGGKILIAVPAHQWMRSADDVVNHHHRRYSKRSEEHPAELQSLMRNSSALFCMKTHTHTT